MLSTRKLLTLLLVPSLALMACTSNAEDRKASTGKSTDLTFAVVTHGPPGTGFWDVVKKGAETAGADYGITVTYQSDNDPQKQSQLIDNAISANVDGLVVSMANPDALRASIEKAIAADIPVITINSGADRSAEFGALAHVGQDETVAGEGAGAKLRAAGVTKLVCIIQEAGNVGLEQRCAGAKNTLGGTVENLQVDVNNAADMESRIQAKLQSDPSINGVLAAGPEPGIAARNAVKSLDKDIPVGAFDLNADVVKAISSGEILFAVDQQQYEQGYLPIVFLYLYEANLNTVGGELPVLTGPGFVTKENVAEVTELASRGTR